MELINSIMTNLDHDHIHLISFYETQIMKFRNVKLTYAVCPEIIGTQHSIYVIEELLNEIA